MFEGAQDASLQIDGAAFCQVVGCPRHELQAVESAADFFPAREGHNDRIVEDRQRFYVLERAGPTPVLAEADAVGQGRVRGIANVEKADTDLPTVRVVDAERDKPVAARFDVRGPTGHFEFARDRRV